MSYCNVLVHVAEDGRRENVVKLGVDFAKRFEAHLCGLGTVLSPDVPGFLKKYMGQEALDAQLERARDIAGKAENVFYRIARQEDLVTEWQAIEGSALEALKQRGRYADLVIVGQNDPDDDEVEDLDVDEAVVAIGRPVLVVPFVGNYAGCGNRVMVAWNRSREATRAIHDAMPILKQAEQVIVCCIDLPRGMGHIPGADITRHLAQHGVNAEVFNTTAKGIGVGETLLSAAADHACDMLVMGAYGHSRMREVVLGGATRTLLRDMTMPVLLSH